METGVRNGMSFRRGTTPTITVEIPTEIDLSQFETMIISLKQLGRKVEKRNESILKNGQLLSITLTQEETLAFKENITDYGEDTKYPAAEIQIRLYSSVLGAYGSQIEPVAIYPVINEEVLQNV